VNTDLKRAGFRTVMTRDDDVFIPLDERAAISNRQQNAVFVSIHFNDSRNHSIHGVEGYYNSGAGAQLAGRIDGDLSRISYVRGAKSAMFRVLRLNQYPACLIECGYLSNNAEARLCATEAYRMKLADGIAEGIIEQRYGEEAARKIAEGPVRTASANPGGNTLLLQPPAEFSHEGWTPEDINELKRLGR
jgi:N-acetylmuramoyl-L-alanine amidase